MSDVNVVYFKKGHVNHPRSTEKLSETNDLLIGQVFNGVIGFYEKEKKDYPKWVSYEKHIGEFNVLKMFVEECDNDLEKVHLVCDWLGEERI